MSAPAPNSAQTRIIPAELGAATDRLLSEAPVLPAATVDEPDTTDTNGRMTAAASAIDAATIKRRARVPLDPRGG